ncbi:MAG: aminoacyl-tRNA hydrolase [Patescibacteria group bacterium]|jgi:PTH1 family peptidyl-tRNA hydrolase|nr:aminoacyl-tRNA hydrolase [Patescibacteria group bacterium]MDD5173019.1 aminoacyl-tRNA hydrolase [Patescibacteria group bacterium]
MILIVGLGNPDKKYEKTRHNVGWLMADELIKKEKWQKDKKADCFYFKKELANQEIIIIKPLAFMNNSGQAVQIIQKKHKIKTENIIIIHDDIDISLGKIKIGQNHSSAGHKGVQSVIDHLKTKNFVRVRVGIKPANELKIPAEKFVLKNFSKKEKEMLKKVLKIIPEAIEIILKEGINRAMSRYNH